MINTNKSLGRRYLVWSCIQMRTICYGKEEPEKWERRKPSTKSNKSKSHWKHFWAIFVVVAELNESKIQIQLNFNSNQSIYLCVAHKRTLNKTMNDRKKYNHVW